MRIPILAVSIAVPLLSASVATAAPAPQSNEVTDLLREQVSAVAELPATEIWRRAGSVRDAVRELDADGVDAHVDTLLGEDAPSEGAALLLGALRLAGNDPDVEQLQERLSPLLTSEREDRALGAAALFADLNFRSLGKEPKARLLDDLRTAAVEADHSPELRLECAHAMFLLGGGNERREARAYMTDFLASSDAELRAQGAVALARTGAIITGDLYDELYRLSKLPGESGVLAASYLERERVREVANRKLKRNMEYYQGLSEDSLADSREVRGLDEFEALMKNISDYHLEGDKVTRQDLLEAAMDGMLRSLDAHSAYLAPKEYRRFEQDLEAVYGGIGAYVAEDRIDGLFTITHPIYSGPAYKAGLMSEDKIVRIDDWATLGQPVDEIIKRLKGRPGTAVKLYVWRRGMDAGLVDRPTEEMLVEIERAAITIPTVQYQLLPGNIGMVSLRDFSRVATSELKKAIDNLMGQGMRGLILDLRNNSGGLLEEARNAAELFLPKDSLVVMTESRIEATRKLKTRRDPTIPAEMPMVVLVNRFSASAAEIVSGALQDHDRALLIGQRTFGKGSVQNLLPITFPPRDDKFDDENKNGRHDNWETITRDWNKNGEFDYAPRVKMTIAKYLLPSGRSIHHEVDKEGNIQSEGGVEPQIVTKARRYEAWRLEEMVKIRGSHAPRDYVDRHWAENRSLFQQIAQNDRKDTSLYPGWDEFVDGLNTPLADDDVRQLVRYEVRRRVQDLRGQEFPPGDFVEDLQVQEGIRQVLAQLELETADIEDYVQVVPSAPSTRAGLATVDDEVEKALARLDQALAGEGSLSEEELTELRKVLAETLDD
jgi:carboxyl-terminal processing protease